MATTAWPLPGGDGQRALAAKNFGADLWLKVATVPENMDPGS